MNQIKPREECSSQDSPAMGEAEQNQKTETLFQELRTGWNHQQLSVFAMLRNRIVTGFFVVVPILLSLLIAWLIYSKLTEWAVDSFEPLLQEYLDTQMIWLGHAIRLISLFFMLLILFIVGQLTKMALGRKAITITQGIFLRLPIINFIYSTCKQIGDALWSSKGGNMFRQVVLIEFPMSGSYAIGFLTNENKRDFEVNERLHSQLVSVFMPTTPNPTSGFLMFIPKENCIFLEMSVSDAMRLIVSCGAVLPGNLSPDVTKQLLQAQGAASCINQKPEPPAPTQDKPTC